MFKVPSQPFFSRWWFLIHVSFIAVRLIVLARADYSNLLKLAGFGGLYSYHSRQPWLNKKLMAGSTTSYTGLGPWPPAFEAQKMRSLGWSFHCSSSLLMKNSGNNGSMFVSTTTGPLGEFCSQFSEVKLTRPVFWDWVTNYAFWGAAEEW